MSWSQFISSTYVISSSYHKDIHMYLAHTIYNKNQPRITQAHLTHEHNLYHILTCIPISYSSTVLTNNCTYTLSSIYANNTSFQALKYFLQQLIVNIFTNTIKANEFRGCMKEENEERTSQETRGTYITLRACNADNWRSCVYLSLIVSPCAKHPHPYWLEPLPAALLLVRLFMSIQPLDERSPSIPLN
jgi:hypothetical protein